MFFDFVFLKCISSRQCMKKKNAVQYFILSSRVDLSHLSLSCKVYFVVNLLIEIM